MSSDELYVRIRNRRDGGDPVYEHVCDRNPNDIRASDGEQPRVLWTKPTGGAKFGERFTWCIEQGYRSRFEIFACPWCFVKLPVPTRRECNCGADEVRESRGTHAFQVQHEFLLHDGTHRRVTVKASVVEFMHEPSCPRYDQKEKD